MDRNQKDALIWAEVLKAVKTAGLQDINTNKQSQGLNLFRGDRVMVFYRNDERGESFKGSIRVFPQADSELTGFAPIPVLFGTNQASIIAAAKSRMKSHGVSLFDCACECTIRVDQQERPIFHAVTSQEARWFNRYEAQMMTPAMTNNLTAPVVRMRYCGKTVAEVQLGHQPRLVLNGKPQAEGSVEKLLSSLITAKQITSLLGGNIPSKDIFNYRAGTLLSALASKLPANKIPSLKQYLQEVLYQDFKSENPDTIEETTIVVVTEEDDDIY